MPTPTLPSLGTPPGGTGPFAKEVCGLRRKLRRSSAAVATSREGYRKPRSGPAILHRRWGRALQMPLNSPMGGGLGGHDITDKRGVLLPLVGLAACWLAPSHIPASHLLCISQNFLR
jgi:hypothetical protein